MDTSPLPMDVLDAPLYIYPRVSLDPHMLQKHEGGLVTSYKCGFQVLQNKRDTCNVVRYHMQHFAH